MKNSKKLKYLFIAVLFFFSNGIFAQQVLETTEKQHYKHSLGFGMGISTGHGLSYRYFGRKLGVQANFSPIKDDDRLMISSGITFLYRIGQIDNVAFYVYQGNHYFFREETETRYGYNNSSKTYEEYTVFVEEKYINSGLGVGAEFLHRDRIGFNLMAGYGQQKNLTYYFFTAEAAVYFKF